MQPIQLLEWHRIDIIISHIDTNITMIIDMLTSTRLIIMVVMQTKEEHITRNIIMIDNTRRIMSRMIIGEKKVLRVD